jgi:hypothetical protein
VRIYADSYAAWDARLNAKNPSPQPVVSLIGYDLIKAYNELERPLYLALVVNDWSGDTLYQKDRLFASFREQDYQFD